MTHSGKRYPFPAPPKEVLAILDDGGLTPHVEKALRKMTVWGAIEHASPAFGAVSMGVREQKASPHCDCHGSKVRPRCRTCTYCGCWASKPRRTWK